MFFYRTTIFFLTEEIMVDKGIMQISKKKTKKSTPPRIFFLVFLITLVVSAWL